VPPVSQGLSSRRRRWRTDPAGAERWFIASLDWARRQQAKSWELRTATSYARLMRDQGRVGEAYHRLAPVYRWFTEGFNTNDLKEARRCWRCSKPPR
jgi:predicted ATPase